MKFILILVATISLLAGFASTSNIEALSPLKAIITRSKCTGCNKCVAVCPTKAITNINGKSIIDPNKCIGCTLCVRTCPQATINMERR